jgi:hypothetical protein
MINSGADRSIRIEKMPGRKLMPVNGKTFRVSRGSGSVAERLHTFMQAHDLGLEELADWLQTHPRTLAQWFDGTTMAPACALISLSLVSRLPQARVYPSQSKEESLRRVQAI